ncbi:uncharacterized protein VP01_3362g2 [Puccinia sorghi]|uniref:Copia protein n=1 Tax=Puccinia sorghi TaxID=27349 RepID=A0A0L6UWX6_9BASI|nr:uncharacterized protein VP01_3362g2 [Puccinia sorghi]
MFQQHTKHIDVNFHWTREIVSSGKVTLTYIPTSQMQADGLKKFFSRPKHQELVQALNLEG